MKKIYIIIAVAIAVIAGTTLAVANSGDESNSSDKQKVAATIYPLYDMTREIAGDEFDVILMLPAGASPHTFDPQPSLLKDLEGAESVFSIGNGLDNWAGNLTESIGAEEVVVDTNLDLLETQDSHDDHDDEDEDHHDEDEHSDEEDEHGHDDEEKHDDEDEHSGHDHGPIDPHYWLSIHNAETIVSNIAVELSELDSENADLYSIRAADYIEELEALEAELEDKASVLAGTNIISLHDAWYYFAAEYNLNIIGTFEPSAGEEPTPQYLANLQEEVEENNVSTLFVEPQLSTASIDTFASDNDLSIAVIDPLGGVDGRDTYIKLMRYNVDQVVSALDN